MDNIGRNRFFGQLSEGVGLPALLAFSAGFGPLLVVITALISRKKQWRLTRFDLACGAVSVAGLVLWAITGAGLVAIFFNIFADLMGTIPTIVKAYRRPDTETSLTYGLGALASLIVLLTIDRWNAATYSFPIYVLAACGLIYIFVRFPRLRFANRTPAKD